MSFVGTNRSVPGALKHINNQNNNNKISREFLRPQGKCEVLKTGHVKNTILVTDVAQRRFWELIY